MTTNKVSKKPRLLKTSEVFKLVRARISLKLDRFICCALESSVHLNPTDSERVKDIIHSRMQMSKYRKTEMGLYGTLESWLYLYHNIGLGSNFSSDQKQEQMRLYRLRWLDSLILEFTAKGD